MNLINVLFPPRCPGCDEILLLEEREEGFCKACKTSILLVKEPVCIHCGKPLLHPKAYCHTCENKEHILLQSKAVYEYEGVMKEAMYRYKYSNRREYAKTFAKEAYKHYAAWIHQMNIDVIIPIPMYRKKERKRGYNQAYVFAKELSLLSGIRCERKLLLRIKNTIPLKSLNPTQRKKNLKKAFIFRKNVVKYENPLLVDDIYTTGATMDAASKALCDAGIRRVYGLCICIGKKGS